MRRYRNWILFTLDLGLIILSYYIALYLRLDLSFRNTDYFVTITKLIPLIVIVNLVFLKIFKVDKTLWRQHSIPEALQIVSALMVSYFILSIIIVVFLDSPIPRSVHIIALLLGILMVEFTRFFYRIYRYYDFVVMKNQPSRKRTFIVGAGDAGQLLLKEIMNNPSYENNVVGFIDDNIFKSDKQINGIPVLGDTANLPTLIKDYNIKAVFIAIPSVSTQRQNELVRLVHESNVEVKILSQSEDLLSDYNVKKNIRPITIEDLLGRREISLNTSEIASIVRDQSIMVTGAAGSIGSELCRQLLKHHPRCLVMIDINENNLYSLQAEFNIAKREGRIKEDINLVFLISSIRDKNSLSKVFHDYKPSTIFHAAAHKHVPFMEDTPAEAIKNNIFGTFNLINLAIEYEVSTFVSISTDKAVNPTNVMGATKRFVEKMIQALGKDSKTKFVAVRFGNVLGSNGSVVPLFTRQIEQGGPVTVTHEEMVRYFMTIPEAVSLVIQAAAYGYGGELFVLDMGEPVKILDLAKKMISLAGFVPYQDIDIEISGLRPGEKLFEELLMDEEGMRPTPNKLIFVARPFDISADDIMEQLTKLHEVVDRDANNHEVIEVLKEVVDTYHPTND